MKSLRVFDRTTMKIIGLFAVAALLFFGVILADLTGFESRIPAQADSARVEGLDYYTGLSDAGMVYGDDQFSFVYDTDLVRDLHQYLVDRKSDFSRTQSVTDLTSYGGDPFEQFMQLTIRYYRGEDCILTRSYSVPTGEMIASDPIKKLLSSDSYRAAVKNSLPLPERWHMVDAYNYLYETPYGQQSISDKASLASLYAAICADLETLTYEDIVSDCLSKEPVAYLDLTYRADQYGNSTETETADPASENKIYNTMSLRVYNDNENTLAWIREHGDGLEIHNAGYYNSLAVISRISDGGMAEFLETSMEEQSAAALRSDPDTLTILEDAELQEKTYELCDSVYLKGKDVTTEEDDLYLVRFLTMDAGTGREEAYWLSSYGYISEDNLKSIGF